MLKINFRSKKISKLEAKTLIYKLKLGFTFPNLNEQEQKRYVIWRDAARCLDRISGNKNAKELSEREYLIGELNSEIQLVELVEKIKYCKEHGHIPNNERVASGQSGTRVYGDCKRCRMGYNRPLSSKEWENFHKMMNRPMTI